MKKFASIALVLAFTGATAFAEDPAIVVEGYVNSGVKIVTNKDGTTIQNYSLDWDDVGTWGTLGATYTGAKSGFTVSVDVSTALFDGDGDEASESTAGIDTAYGWLSPVEGLKLFAGNTYSGAFDGLDDDSNDYFDSTGASATYSISGLTLGAGAVYDTTASTHADSVFGAAYALDKVVSARFSALVDGAEGKLAKFSASASFPVVDNLTLKAGVLGEGQDDETTAKTWLDATVGYKVNALAGQVVTYYTLENEDAAILSALTVTPRITYTVSPEVTVYAQDAFKLVDSEFTTQVVRLQGVYKVDAASSITVRGQYDTDAETSTVYVDYLFSF